MAAQQSKSDVVAEQIETVKQADSLKDTTFSKLFHEARTTTPDDAGTHGYSGVTVQIRVSDDMEFETYNVVKTRQGEHLRGTDAWDGKVSLVVKPFMETETAQWDIIRQLKTLKQMYLRQEGY